MELLLGGPGVGAALARHTFSAAATPSSHTDDTMEVLLQASRPSVAAARQAASSAIAAIASLRASSMNSEQSSNTTTSVLASSLNNDADERTPCWSGLWTRSYRIPPVSVIVGFERTATSGRRLLNVSVSSSSNKNVIAALGLVVGKFLAKSATNVLVGWTYSLRSGASLNTVVILTALVTSWNSAFSPRTCSAMVLRLVSSHCVAVCTNRSLFVGSTLLGVSTKLAIARVVSSFASCNSERQVTSSSELRFFLDRFAIYFFFVGIFDAGFSCLSL